LKYEEELVEFEDSLSEEQRLEVYRRIDEEREHLCREGNDASAREQSLEDQRAILRRWARD
jgi:hypothetical protein